jgi:Capsular polysaccharide biosynthesis protein
MSKKFYDIHCHYMYGVDDGSKSPEMTLSMLDQAYEQGVRGVIMTPHYNPKAWHKSAEELRERFREVRKLVKAKGHADMKLWLGSEIFYHKDKTPSEMLDGNLISMAKSGYLLMEFHTTVEYSYIEAAVTEAQGAGYIPILAHIERFDALRGDLDKVAQIKNAGALIQVNASSVIGDEGFRIKSFVKKLLKNRMIEFVATDTHRDAKWRVPNLGPAADYIYKKCSENYADEIFIHNPRMIIENELP